MDQKLTPKRVEQYHYQAELPFTQRPNGLEINKKSGLRVTVSLGAKMAKGDISPFPGLCKYSLNELEKDWNDLWSNHLEVLTDYFNGDKLIPEQILNLKGPLEFTLLTLKLSLSHTAISSAILENLVTNSQSWKESLLKKKNSHFPQPIKVKVRPQDQEDFLAGLSILTKSSEQLPGRIIRIDGNASWELKELKKFWSEIQATHREQIFDYFEEPLKSYGEYKSLDKELPTLPYAHEEHLEHFFKNPSMAQALVLKPSQLGVSVLEEAKNIGINTRLILSSAFELPESLNTLKYLAELYSPKEFHGLGAKIKEKEIKKSKD